MSTFIQTLKLTPRIDEPEFWAETDVIAQPQFDVKGFQKRIDKIVGVTREKKSIVQLKWAWDESCFSLFFTHWDASGEPVKGDLRAKYIYKTIEIDSEHQVDICPPRWVLEERIEPEQYYQAWEQNRWQKMAIPQDNPDGKKREIYRQVVTRPRAPRDGYYAFLYYIASHDPENACCVRALKANHECFGAYRKPSEWDLFRLARMKRAIEENGNPNPYQPLDADTFAQIQADSESVERAAHQKKMAKRDEDRREFRNILKPSAAFSLPEKRTEGGLILLP